MITSGLLIHALLLQGQSDVVSLCDFTPISGEQSITVSGSGSGSRYGGHLRTFTSQLLSPKQKLGEVTYDLAGRYGTLRAQFVVPYEWFQGHVPLDLDRFSNSGNAFPEDSGKYSIEADGRVLASGEVTRNGRSPVVSVPVVDVSQLTIRLSGTIYCVDPTLHKGLLSEAIPPQMLEPKHSSTLRSNMATFRWKSASQADRTVLQLTRQRSTGSSKGSEVVLWSMPATSSEITKDLSDFPDGNYVWQIFSFQSSGAPIASKEALRFTILRESEPHTGHRVPDEGENLELAANPVHPDWAPLYSKREGQLSVRGSGGYFLDLKGQADHMKVTYYGGNLDESGLLVITADGLDVMRRVVPPGANRVTETFPIQGANHIAILVKSVGIEARFLQNLSPTELQPPDKEQTSKKEVWLRWKPVRGATSYVVKLTCLRLAPNEKLPQDPIRTFTASTASLTVPLTALPRGWYEWQVLGITDNAAVGKWSDPHRIRLLPQSP